jgi:FkbM family methyltransferase
MNDESLEAQLRELLEGDEGRFQARERALLDRLAAPLAKPPVLFGAGRLGRIALAGLRRAGVNPPALADNNPALWGREVDGLPVLSPQDAADRFGADAPFVVTIYTGARVLQQLRDRGLRAFPFAALFLKHHDVLLPHVGLDLPSKVYRHVADVRAGLFVWADEASRREYVAQVRYRLSLDERLPPPLPPEQTYFPEDLVPLSPDERFVDCGAYDGDSVRGFLKRRGTSFGHVHAVEPDPVNCGKLRQFVAGLPAELSGKLTVIQSAAGARRERVRFAATGTAESSVQGGGAFEVECAPLDELLAGAAPTYVKMDIEGAEPEALAGAHALIREHAPVLAVCLYHSQEHLWQIPLLIRSLSDRYRLFLRRYSDALWEQVCYAVPAHRLKGAG